MRIKKTFLYVIAGFMSLTIIAAGIIFRQLEGRPDQADFNKVFMPQPESEADRFILSYSRTKQIRSDLVMDDLWGTPLKVWEQNNKMFVLSAGPDKVFDTQDDIIFSKDIPNEH